MTSSYLRGDDLVAPLRIHADRTTRIVSIEWADGHLTAYSFDQLRWLCPCAYCRGEAGRPGWLDTNPTLTAEQTRLVAIEPIGNYAICPSWGDGHHTGYYPYTALRASCPCPSCTAARAAGGSVDKPGGAR